jgi:hypothetical protein
MRHKKSAQTTEGAPERIRKEQVSSGLFHCKGDYDDEQKIEGM